MREEKLEAEGGVPELVASGRVCQQYQAQQ